MPYYCLSFDYRFEHYDDEVFFAYTIPYGYTQMQRHLVALSSLKELKGRKYSLHSCIYRSQDAGN